MDLIFSEVAIDEVEGLLLVREEHRLLQIELAQRCGVTAIELSQLLMALLLYHLTVVIRGLPLLLIIRHIRHLVDEYLGLHCYLVLGSTIATTWAQHARSLMRTLVR